MPLYSPADTKKCQKAPQQNKNAYKKFCSQRGLELESSVTLIVHYVFLLVKILKQCILIGPHAVKHNKHILYEPITATRAFLAVKTYFYRSII